MRVFIFCALFLVCSAAVAATPSVDRIDYEDPDKYLEIPESLGSRESIEGLAVELKGESDRLTVRNVLEWKEQNLSYDSDLAYEWRNFDTVVEEGCIASCADEGIFCGTVLKAAGIPTVWVKTMDVDWIRDFKKGHGTSSWRGHVFLEIYLDGKWCLLNPGEKMLYRDYMPAMRILPGNRFAYDKGNDPKAMVMSLQWEEWKKQTSAYFSGLDEALLPVDTRDGMSLSRNQAYVIGNSPYYERLTEMAKEEGYRMVWSFNGAYDRFLPRAEGHLLLVETHGEKPIVAQEVLEAYFPGAFEALEREDRTTLVKGTTIVFFDFENPEHRLKTGAEVE